MKLLIRGADLCLLGAGIGDILLEEDRVAAIGGTIEADAEVLEANGLLAAPGLVDMHVHLRDPGQTHKEDILTGCEAAAQGGVTSLLAMPNTSPATDSPETVQYILDKAKNAAARVYVAAAISKGLRGAEMTDFAALRAAGAIAVTDDGRPVPTARMQMLAMEKAREQGLLPISHAEDLSVINGGIMNDGAVSRALGVPGMNRLSEDLSTARELMIAEYYGLPIHIAHVSTRGAVELIRQAKARGVRVSCETGPHYFSLTEERLLTRDADYRMNPPLREKEDRLAIIRGLADGTIDAIATDHAPHSPQEKECFEKAPNGVIGLSTSLAAGITALVEPGFLSLSALIDKMSRAPARLLGIEAGEVRVGGPADVILFDPSRRWKVEPEKLGSRSRNSAFKGMELTGRVMATICRGRIVMRRV